MDNLDSVELLMNFEHEWDFYYLIIIKRKKDNPKENIKNNIKYKTYYIKSEEELLDKYKEIKNLCDYYNARAMIYLNKRNMEDIKLTCVSDMLTTVQANNLFALHRSVEKTIGQHNSERKERKKWIVDLDFRRYDDENAYRHIHASIELARPTGDKKISEIPSVSGCHIITSPFDLQQFRETHPDIDVHKDNPVNLYIPKKIAKDREKYL